MRWILTISIMVSSLLCVVHDAEGDVDVGVSIGDDGLKGFYLAVGDYFQTPEKEIVLIRERQVPDEEIPVVFFIAEVAHVSPYFIVDLRMWGHTWWDIVIQFGLSPEVFYVPVVHEVKGPPYGKAYGHYKNKPEEEWGKIVLTDEEIINLTNLKFVSEYYQYPPEKVIEMKSSGKNFVVINDVVLKEKSKGNKHRTTKGKGRGPK